MSDLENGAKATTTPLHTNSKRSSERHSTPFSLGSATYGKHSLDDTTEALQPFYEHDLKKIRYATVEETLTCLASRVLTTKGSIEEEENRYAEMRGFLQQRCNSIFPELHGITGAKNGLGPRGGGGSKQRSKKARKSAPKSAGTANPAPVHRLNMKQRNAAAEIVSAISAFREAPNEAATYPAFASFANNTMCLFNSEKIPHLTDMDQKKKDESLVFHVNDPRHVYGSSQRETLVGKVAGPRKLKPDLVLVQLDTVRTVHPSINNPSWEQCITLLAHSPPEKGRRFEWRKILLAVEGKYEPDHPEWPSKWQESALKEVEIGEQRTSETLPPVHEEEDGLREKEVPKTLAALLKKNKERSTDSSEPRRSSRSTSSNLKRPPPPASANDSTTANKRSRSRGSQTPSLRGKDHISLGDGVQVAYYASERLTSSPTISHAIDLYYKGSRLYIWFFDRAGSLRSSGFDIIEDYPFFVLLLAILQRFSPVDWGCHDAIRDPSGGPFQDGERFHMPLQGPDGRTINFAVSHKALPKHLHGRGTLLSGATSNDPNPFDAQDNLANHDMVMKLYRADISRESEAHHLMKAYRISAESRKLKLKGSERDCIRGHIPVLIACGQWEEPFTETFNKHLPGRRPLTRRLVALVFPELLKITDMAEDYFLGSVFDCFLCHYKLWKNDICHRDISHGNLMVCAFGEFPQGVLIDFDLAVNNNDTRKYAMERTGTWRYMAMELLNDTSGAVIHRYALDVESFIWVVLWITRNCGWEEKLVQPRFMEWDDMTGNIAASNKLLLCLTYPSKLPKAPKYFQSCESTVLGLLQELYELVKLEVLANTAPRLSDDEVFQRFSSRFQNMITWDQKRSNEIADEAQDPASLKKNMQARSKFDDGFWEMLAEAKYGFNF